MSYAMFRRARALQNQKNLPGRQWAIWKTCFERHGDPYARSSRSLIVFQRGYCSFEVLVLLETLHTTQCPVAICLRKHAQCLWRKLSKLTKRFSRWLFVPNPYPRQNHRLQHICDHKGTNFTTCGVSKVMSHSAHYLMKVTANTRCTCNRVQPSIGTLQN